MPLTGGFKQQEDIVQNSGGPTVKDQSLGSDSLPLSPGSGSLSMYLPPALGQAHSLQLLSDFLSTSGQSSLWMCPLSVSSFLSL